VLPSLYGTVALQLGRIGKLDLLDACIAPTRVMLDVDGVQARKRSNVEQTLSAWRTRLVLGESDALPLGERSVDVALLPHTLDFCDDPHAVLREVNRVLRPEGHVVILGFNPMSLWGLRRLVSRRPRPAPWCGQFFRLARVKDWLALLDFEFTQGGMLYYRPPVNRETLDRLFFFEKAGDRWWPMMAAAYLIVAKKRVFGMTPLSVAWKKQKAIGIVGTEPAVRGALQGGCRRVRRYG
jgi:SAM-dependent methyltransferase